MTKNNYKKTIESVNGMLEKVLRPEYSTTIENEEIVVKHNIKMNLKEMYNTLEGIDAVIGREIGADGKDILHHVRKQLTKPLAAHGIISKEKARDPFAE